MASTIQATFDGTVFRPLEPVSLEPNTQVRLVVEPVAELDPHSGSFLDTALSLQLEGPPDWAANVDRYLYGEDGAFKRC